MRCFLCGRDECSLQKPCAYATELLVKLEEQMLDNAVKDSVLKRKHEQVATLQAVIRHRDTIHGSQVSSTHLHSLSGSQSSQVQLNSYSGLEARVKELEGLNTRKDHESNVTAHRGINGLEAASQKLAALEPLKDVLAREAQIIGKCTELTHELEETTAQMDALRSQKTQLELEILAKDQSLSTQVDQILDREKVIGQLSEDKAMLTDAVSKIEDKAEMLEKQIKKLQNDLEYLQARSKGTIDDLKAEHQKADFRHKQQLYDYKQISERCTAGWQQVTRLETQLESVQEVLTTHHDENTRLRLESEILRAKELESEAKDKELAKMKDLADDRIAELNMADTILNEKNEEISDLITSIAEREMDFELKEKELADIKELMKDGKAKIEAAERMLEMKNKQIKGLCDEQIANEDQAFEMEAQIKLLKDKLSQATSELQMFQSTAIWSPMGCPEHINHLHRQLSHLAESNEEVEKALQAKIIAMQGQIDSHAKVMDNLHVQFAEASTGLQEKVVHKEHENKEMQAKVDQLNEKLDEWTNLNPAHTELKTEAKTEVKVVEIKSEEVKEKSSLASLLPHTAE